MSLDIVKAAVVQAAPVYMNIDQTVDKVCEYIKKAALCGADIIAFPEAFISGYPWYAFVGPGGYCQKFHPKLLDNAIVISDNSVSILSECCRKQHIVACIPVIERVRDSVYLTQLWFDANGNLIGVHRKSNLVQSERIIFKNGDGCMPVMSTEIGNVGGLMGWEHMSPVNLPVMSAQYEQIHVSSWTSFASDEDSLFSKEAALIVSRYYAQSTGTYILMSSQPYTKEMSEYIITEKWHEDPVPFGGTQTCIINPHGKLLATVENDSVETIIYADLDLREILRCKFLVDITGHYSTPGILNVKYNGKSKEAVNLETKDNNFNISYEKLRRVEA